MNTFASRLTTKGRPVSELLGHSSVKMTERYTHLARERLRDCRCVLEDFNTTSHGPAKLTPQLVPDRPARNRSVATPGPITIHLDGE